MQLEERRRLRWIHLRAVALVTTLAPLAHLIYSACDAPAYFTTMFVGMASVLTWGGSIVLELTVGRAGLAAWFISAAGSTVLYTVYIVEFPGTLAGISLAMLAASSDLPGAPAAIAASAAAALYGALCAAGAPLVTPGAIIPGPLESYAIHCICCFLALLSVISVYTTGNARRAGEEDISASLAAISNATMALGV
jgi:hypothetical protein